MSNAIEQEYEAARDEQNRVWSTYGEYARSIYRHAMPLWNLRWSRACKRVKAAEQAVQTSRYVADLARAA